MGRSRFCAAALASLWVLGLCAVAAFWRDGQQDWRTITVLVVSLLAGGMGVKNWWCTPSGRLRWDGEDWTLLGFTVAAKANALGRVSVILDFQHNLLLQLDLAGGRSGWCSRPRLVWLERRLAPPDWDDLRRAVYSRARIDALREPDERLRGDNPLP
ncbi:hypothetical protein ACO2Q9_17595 [Variovorax sp. VNK109]|uniref:hypothetical protein n=1 Tax=Variovorax sp. VNK109 TaxID=3400919 RepID=UPI003C034661